MIELDGADGGGQIVRSALSLAALAGESVRIENVRGARDDPGLKHQHLAAVELLAAVCDADVEGADLGAETLTFEPDSPSGGRYEVDVGTAGSVTLVLDAVLPLAAAIDGPLAVTIRGGTDVKWSPPIDAVRNVKLPLLRRHDVQAALDVDRRGFYPAGGGAATLSMAPSTPTQIQLTDRGERRGVRIYSVASADLADAEVAERQARGAAAALPDGVDVIERSATYADADSTGTALTFRADYENALAGADALGERGKPAERVGEDAVRSFRTFEESAAVVDRHLADQLLVWLALAGGEIAIPEVTDHVESSIELLGEFGVDAEIESGAEGAAAARIRVRETLDRR
ncbi:RNA 3'-terminal phosphate cyclase (ATP) [Natronoarchaeum philippinense]|uniref:RNA 3'-terminal phosphate cyclase n=1 Tax=Natronoarchaeum philippinense TaxID=558529 RepID=A0A285N7S9_NATPI|nr:RNA 3'-terminal phosphate cyclase [Natronoarchaeum philippinense]SNZ04026.1 RNA 3'-terminal phosphate cyclase (ATP) [Natronoarchaeum philippinense]